jgi:hypothetical protein
MIIYLLGTGGDALTTMCARGCEKIAQLCKANLCTLGMMMMGDHHHSEVSEDLGGFWRGGGMGVSME